MISSTGDHAQIAEHIVPLFLSQGWARTVNNVLFGKAGALRAVNEILLLRHREGCGRVVAGHLDAICRR